jgi:hypothetical protein
MGSKAVGYAMRWRPSAGKRFKALSLGNPGETEEALALAVLSALSIAGIHSAINPSLFTLLSFATKPEAQARAMNGLWIGLGASTLASAAIWVVFKKWMPAIMSEATAIALFGAGVWAVHQKPTDAIPAIEEQTEPPQPAAIPRV